MTNEKPGPRWARLSVRLAQLCVLAAIYLTRWMADSEAEAYDTVADMATDSAIELAPDIRAGLRHIRHFLPRIPKPKFKGAAHGTR